LSITRVDHIGIVVADIEAAKAFFGETLGLPLSPRSPEAGVKAAFYRCGDMDIQVIQVDDPEVRRRRLGEGNIARFEHIALEVDRLEPLVDRLRTKGVEMLTPTPYAYTTPEPGKPEGRPHRSIFTTERGGLGLVFQLRDSDIR